MSFQAFFFMFFGDFCPITRWSVLYRSVNVKIFLFTNRLSRVYYGCASTQSWFWRRDAGSNRGVGLNGCTTFYSKRHSALAPGVFCFHFVQRCFCRTDFAVRSGPVIHESPPEGGLFVYRGSQIAKSHFVPFRPSGLCWRISSKTPLLSLRSSAFLPN